MGQSGNANRSINREYPYTVHLIKGKVPMWRLWVCDGCPLYNKDGTRFLIAANKTATLPKSPFNIRQLLPSVGNQAT